MLFETMMQKIQSFFLDSRDLFIRGTRISLFSFRGKLCTTDACLLRGAFRCLLWFFYSFFQVFSSLFFFSSLFRWCNRRQTYQEHACFCVVPSGCTRARKIAFFSCYLSSVFSLFCVTLCLFRRCFPP